MADSLIREVTLNRKEVAAMLAPPLAGLGFLFPSLAPKEEKRNVTEMIIYLTYDLAACYGVGLQGATRVGTRLSGRISRSGRQSSAHRRSLPPQWYSDFQRPRYRLPKPHVPLPR
jgi:hypothetical protein